MRPLVPPLNLRRATVSPTTSNENDNRRNGAGRQNPEGGHGSRPNSTRGHPRSVLSPDRGRNGSQGGNRTPPNVGRDGNSTCRWLNTHPGGPIPLGGTPLWRHAKNKAMNTPTNSEALPPTSVSLPASMKNLLHYEICAAWWPQFVSWGPLQNIIAAHFARKIERKYRRWMWCLERQERTARLAEPTRYTGHVTCSKCGNTHWMHGPCPPQNDQA